MQISTKTVLPIKTVCFILTQMLNVWCAHQFIYSQLIFLYKSKQGLFFFSLNTGMIEECCSAHIYLRGHKSQCGAMPSGPSPAASAIGLKMNPSLLPASVSPFHEDIQFQCPAFLLVSVKLDSHCGLSRHCATPSHCISTGLFLCNLLHNVILLFLPFPCHQPL